ncbi:MAG: terminase gpA endonuclease subunit [Phycisphaeraceae bacterium]
MAIDPAQLSPTQLVRLLNSTPLGPVINAAALHRQRNEAGLRIASDGDGKRIHLVKYVKWLVRELEKPPPAPSDYTDRLRRDLQRKLEASRQGRDIGPVPDVVDMQRRQRCEGSFRDFCEIYFPAAFSLPWSQDHLRIIEKIERAVLEGGLFAFAMPRGSGKTTLCQAAGMWAILCGYREYICLIGSAEDQAKTMLESIKREMLGNPLLLEDFPETIFPIRKLENNARKQAGQLCDGEPTYITWAADKLVMPTMGAQQLPMALQRRELASSPSSGSIITVAGLDSNIRGQHHTKMDGTVVRPSLVILDDPQTRQSAASTTQTRHRLSILNGDVLGMAGPNVKMAGFMTCTKIHHDDLADQILDRQKNPEWQGECTKLVYSFPTDEKRWDRYAQLRAEGLREGDGGKRATELYRRDREQMDDGAVVAWPERYNADELSALQHAMNLKLRDEDAFFAEYQNEPATAQLDEDVLTPDEVAERVSGRPRIEVPKPATSVTAFIDVQEKMLFYTVCAWESDFTGHVIDYGTLPDQKRRYFTLRDTTKTLAATYSGGGIEGAIQAGLEELVGRLLDRQWEVMGDGGVMRIERLLIDAGYLPGIVANVCHKLGAVAMPSKGVGIRAGNKPMSAYRRKPGERHGHHWYVPNVSRTAELRHVMIDTNYWKSFVHARFATAPGDRGALTLFGRSPAEHRLFADHIAASETWTRTEGHGRLVQEWSIRPSKPDNHWLDCLVGAAVAASMCGVRFGVEPAEAETQRPIRLSALKQQRNFRAKQSEGSIRP